MNKLTILIACAVIGLGAVSINASVPNLYVNGVVADASVYRLTGLNEDLVFNFSYSTQYWKLINERTPYADLNSFGAYTDLSRDLGGRLNDSGKDTFNPGFTTAGGLNTTTIFEAANSAGNMASTNFEAGTDVGFWLLNDLNGNDIYDGYDRHIYSERALSRGAEDLTHQGFMVYDVSSFGENRFSYGGVEFSGNYDYLIFAEDNPLSKSHHYHNDMVVGLSSVPEPATLILLGAGLIGTGLVTRRRKK